MPLETFAVLLGVLGHGNEHQYLEHEAGFPRVEKHDLPLDEARFLEVTDAPPAGGAGHADDLGEFALVARGVSLQFRQKAPVGTGQFHLGIPFV